MCMSYDHPKPIRMHALTLFNDMRHPKLPQRPRGSPGPFTFFKNFEHTKTDQYTRLPMTIFFALSELVVRKAPAPDAPVRTPAQNWPAPRRRLAAILCRANLCHQTFLGILCHQEFFSGRSVSPEWQPYRHCYCTTYFTGREWNEVSFRSFGSRYLLGRSRNQ